MTFEELMGSFSINNDLCNRKVYGQLLAQLRDNRVTPVIGAGLSCWAGYPLWSALLKALAAGTHCDAAVKTLLNENRYEAAAAMLERFYTPGPFQDSLKEAFSPDKLDEKKRPPEQRLLGMLFPGPIVTTNYDVSLERLLDAPPVITPENDFDAAALTAAIQQNQRVLIKLHGTVDDPAHMILSEESYNRAYGSDPEQPDLSLPIPSALQRVFQAAPPLFLGCGLDADRTCAVLRACKGALGFALLSLPEETVNGDDPLSPKLFEGDGFLPALQKRREQLDAMGVRVIWYPKGQRDAVKVLLEQLAEDLNLSPAASPAPDAEELLYTADHDFIGREAFVRELADWLAESKASLLLVHGIAGIGKTALCKAAYRAARERDAAFSLPLIDLAETLSVPDFLARLARALEISTEAATEEALLAVLRPEIFARSRTRRCRVYLDNFEALWNPLDEAARNRLTDTLSALKQSGLLLLIASQVRVLADKTFSVKPLDGGGSVKALSRSEFSKLERTRLFLQAFRREPTPEEIPDLVTLLEETGGHPLAILLTAHYGDLGGMTIHDLLTDWHTLELHIPGDRAEHDSLTKALALSWAAVRNSRPAVLRWALLAGSILPLDEETLEELRALLPERFSDGEWREGCRRLYALGLLTRDEARREQMLPVVRKTFPLLEEAAAQAAALADGVWLSWGAALLEAGDRLGAADYLAKHDRALAWLPQCFSLAEQALEKADYPGLEKLLRDAGNYYQFHVALALPLLSQLCARTPADFPLRGKCLQRFGDLLRLTGKPDEALQCYDKAEELYQNVHDDLGRANVLKGRGDLLRVTGKPDKALKCYRDAEELYQKEHNDLGRANVLSGRGDLLRRTGKPDKALRCYD